MSQAQIFELGPDLGWKNLGFPDLEIRFERHLEKARSLTDLEHLIRSIQPLFKDERYNLEELVKLKRLRQRLYDQKRTAKFQIPRSDKPRSQMPRSGTKTQIPRTPDLVPQIAPLLIPDKKTQKEEAIMPNITTLTPTPQKTPAMSFGEGIIKGMTSIDGEQFIKTVPQKLMWLAAAGLVSFFLWQQSFALYESAGFTNSFYAAIGSILMIVGFAAYHSITKSWLALFFCLYAGAYEGYFMVSGTIYDDKQAAISSIESDRELIFLQQKADKEHEKYAELKQRYDDPESKVFKNDWFSKNHLTPAWEANTQAHAELIAKRVALITATNDMHVTWLKIFYRLGLVFLCMMLVHRFFASCVAK